MGVGVSEQTSDLVDAEHPLVLSGHLRCPDPRDRVAVKQLKIDRVSEDLPKRRAVSGDRVRRACTTHLIDPGLEVLWPQITEPNRAEIGIDAVDTGSVLSVRRRLHLR